MWEQLNLLKQGKMTVESFCEFLEGSISALDGIPYSVISQSRDFEYLFTMARFCEYPEHLTMSEVIQNLRNWLTDVEKKYSMV